MSRDKFCEQASIPIRCCGHIVQVRMTCIEITRIKHVRWVGSWKAGGIEARRGRKLPENMQGYRSDRLWMNRCSRIDRFGRLTRNDCAYTTMSDINTRSTTARTVLLRCTCRSDVIGWRCRFTSSRVGVGRRTKTTGAGIVSCRTPTTFGRWMTVAINVTLLPTAKPYCYFVDGLNFAWRQNGKKLKKIVGGGGSASDQVTTIRFIDRPFRRNFRDV